MAQLISIQIHTIFMILRRLRLNKIIGIPQQAKHSVAKRLLVMIEVIGKEKDGHFRASSYNFTYSSNRWFMSNSFALFRQASVE